MDLQVWQDELHKFGLLTKHEHILHGFQHGFDQGIPFHGVEDKKYFSPPNHASALKAKSEIEENFTLEIKCGRMFGPYQPEDVWEHFGFFRTSPLGAVINGDGSTRPINDLSFPKDDRYIDSVNSFVDKAQFETTWDDFAVVARFVKECNEHL